MKKVYSLLSWNIEHLGGFGDSNFEQRLARVTGEIKKADPDVFALYEVEGKEVFGKLVNIFPGYSFHITEGPQVQEILVGVRGGITSFFTQRVEFKSGNHLLRPGALLTLDINGEEYPILFLHLKSFDNPRGFGLRDDMLSKAIKFAGVLKRGDKPANYLFIGDLNTMGLNYYFDRDIPPDTELKKSDIYAKRYYDMIRLEKTYPFTWSNGSSSSYPPANLDHCYAAGHLQFKMFTNKDRVGQSPIDVCGWVDEHQSSKQDKWIKDYSDHAYLYLEIMK